MNVSALARAVRRVLFRESVTGPTLAGLMADLAQLEEAGDPTPSMVQGEASAEPAMPGAATAWARIQLELSKRNLLREHERIQGVFGVPSEERVRTDGAFVDEKGRCLGCKRFASRGGGSAYGTPTGGRRILETQRRHILEDYVDPLYGTQAAMEADLRLVLDDLTRDEARELLKLLAKMKAELVVAL